MIVVFMASLLALAILLLHFPVVVKIGDYEGPVQIAETFSPFRSRRRIRFVVKNPSYKFADLDAFDLETGKKASINDWYAINKVRDRHFDEQERQARIDAVKEFLS